ncbi:MAG: single-stranded DNA-binding protein [Desulfosarcinaceae bacterium]|nr:single-stranded DNA-binding protein [Desulfosarcinaceae bacterium]
MTAPDSWTSIFCDLIEELKPLTFHGTAAHVYNPLIYAAASHDAYFTHYGQGQREILLVGMNPGPWGMAQTGVPFGEVAAVRDWLKIEAPVGEPPNPHPKKPVTGFACHRSEVSGRRVWGWAKAAFGEPERFFKRFFIFNYCPLLFLDKDGRNLTPDKFKLAVRRPLQSACDRALLRAVRLLKPTYVIGIGRFAEAQIVRALAKLPIHTGCITHPSPANPKANRGWRTVIQKELGDLGIMIS